MPRKTTTGANIVLVHCYHNIASRMYRMAPQKLLPNCEDVVEHFIPHNKKARNATLIVAVKQYNQCLVMREIFQWSLPYIKHMPRLLYFICSLVFQRL